MAELSTDTKLKADFKDKVLIKFMEEISTFFWYLRGTIYGNSLPGKVKRLGTTDLYDIIKLRKYSNYKYGN